MLCHFDGRLPWCLNHGMYFVLNDSVIQGSLNIHCSNTPKALGVKLNMKKEFVTCFVIGGKPLKGKTKGILLGKLIFPPSA